MWPHTNGLQCVITGVTYSSTKRFSNLTIKALEAENLLNKHVFCRDFLIKISAFSLLPSLFFAEVKGIRQVLNRCLVLISLHPIVMESLGLSDYYH